MKSQSCSLENSRPTPLTPRRWHVSDCVGLLTLKFTETLLPTILGLLFTSKICSGRSG